MSAHDVRRLRVCPVCRGIGADRDMVRVGQAHLHGACAGRAMSPEELLQLPACERGKLRVDDVGADTLQRLLDAD
jgi:hypothetical protein